MEHKFLAKIVSTKPPTLSYAIKLLESIINDHVTKNRQKSMLLAVKEDGNSLLNETVTLFSSYKAIYINSTVIINYLHGYAIRK